MRSDDPDVTPLTDTVTSPIINNHVRPESGSAASGTGVEWEPMWELIKRLPAYARLTAAMARDPRVPTSAKAMLVVAGAYLVSPIDLIPGVIPVAGQLDDLYVVLTGLQQAIRVTPGTVVDEHVVAVGLTRDTISEDLAAVRTFVWQGIQWTFQKSGAVMAAAGRQAVSLAERARAWGVNRYDQESI